jgi:hypothetical protein
MIPREHLPLTLVTVALLGFIFLLFREINAVKGAVAQLSIPTVVRSDASFKDGGEDDENDEDDDDDNEDDDDTLKDTAKVGLRSRTQKPAVTTPKSIVNSSSEKSLASAATKGASR